MIKNVNQSVKKHWPAFVFGPMLKMVEAIFDLLIPLVMKAVIDLSFSNPRDVLSQGIGSLIKSMGTWVEGSAALNYALIGGTLILLMSVLGFMTTMITQYVAAKTAIQCGTEIRDSLYQKILSLSKKDLEKISLNKLLTILNSDSYQVQQGVLMFIRLVVRAPFIILGALVFSMILDWQIGLVFVVITPMIIFVIFFIMTKASREYLTIQGKLDGLSRKSSDTLEGSKVVRAFNKIEDENNEFEALSLDYQKTSIHVQKMNALINPLTFGIVTIATIFVILLGGINMADNGSVQPSTLITEVAYLDQIFVTTVQLTNLIMVFTKSIVSIKRVNSVLRIEPDIYDDKEKAETEVAVGEEILKFDHVSFGYEETGNKALTDIDFSLKKGQTLGIIGGTGSGKSTLIRLLERFVDASDGRVIYKGMSIKDYRLKTLRSEIGYVPQKSVLFKGTIRSNLLMANPNATEEEMTKALKNALAYEFVSKYDDYLDHEVEEGGHNFSGGQRQRLCIARALVRKPEVLIFDDSTSALDLLTDKSVRNNIATCFPEATKIISSQRISTIQDSDLILVLEGGKVIAKGKHDDLLSSCDVYKETYESQTRKEN